MMVEQKKNKCVNYILKYYLNSIYKWKFGTQISKEEFNRLNDLSKIVGIQKEGPLWIINQKADWG